MKNKQDSFEDIAMPWLDAVYRGAVALCRDRNQADDLVQATFLKAYEQFDTFRRGSNCKAWLLRILRNTWIDRLRHRKVVGPVAEMDETLIAAKEPDSPAENGDWLEKFADEEVIRALKNLPEDQRLALMLVDVEQLSQQEAADILQVPVGTVKSRSSRARKTLKDELFAHAHDMGWAGGQR